MGALRTLGGPVVRAARNRSSPYPELIDHRTYRGLRVTPTFTPGITTVRGKPLAYSDVKGFLYSLHEIFVDEVYRFDHPNGSPRIIDAGANIGLSVLYFKDRFPDARVIAYEPDPQMFEMLAHNTAGLDGVELHETAVWVEDTDLTFHTEGSLGGSTEVRPTGAIDTVQVKAERLRSELMREPVDFLKIDIEGAENQVLFDIEDQLDRVGLLFFEYHSTKVQPQRLGAMLEMVSTHGFRYVINGSHAARLPFVESTNSAFDLQVNVSCFR